jgi:hypothetical protein
MTERRYLAETECWRISGLTDAEAFFRAVMQMLPEATHMFLEGSPDPDIVALLSKHAEDVEYVAPTGTLWSWPRENRFVVRPSAALFDKLSAAAAHLAEPEICSHLHFYRDVEPLAQWFDAFVDPLFVSTSIPREKVEQFARAAGGSFVDTAA